VIDDDPSVRMVLIEVLREAGYVTLEAADGPTGLKILCGKCCHRARSP
jgi:CheY-like chemotaxis protein